MEDRQRRRSEKRDIKREGNRRRRRTLKRQLEVNPDEAAFAGYEFRFDSSAVLNEPANRSKKKAGKRPRARVRDEEE